eukprot:scaffold120704_cov54-Phaeocystis_antarctica.AAC.2
MRGASRCAQVPRAGRSRRRCTGWRGRQSTSPRWSRARRTRRAAAPRRLAAGGDEQMSPVASPPRAPRPPQAPWTRRRAGAGWERSASRRCCRRR